MNQNDSPTSPAVAGMTKRTRPKGIHGPEAYIQVRQAFLQKKADHSLTKMLLEEWRDMDEYEDYLREKWGCNEPIPPPFDAVELEKVYLEKYARMEHEPGSEPVPQTNEDPMLSLARPQNELKDTPIQAEELENYMYSTYSDLFSHKRHAVFISSPETEKETEGPESGVPVDGSEISSEDIILLSSVCGSIQLAPETLERTLTPRIRVGSKPPLSRSAFAEGRVSYSAESCQLGCKKERKSAPEYFPFKSRLRTSSGSTK
ncbi:hypothetical protein F4802DRAFT_600583 [Xylaria palmicola]|nr:hypothetical protein F4802DRAFT_600583 [Xylaria palmicola]